jgi:anti-anti-sigma factor
MEDGVMKLNVLSSEGGIAHVECTDDLTMLEVTGNDPLDRLLGPGCYARTVLLCLAKASYIDSAGIGWLVMCHKHFIDGGGRLIVHSLAPMVSHAFEVLGLNAMLSVAANEAAARVLAVGNTSQGVLAPKR